MDQIWAWLPRRHRSAVGVRDPLKSSVTGPCLLVNCYLEIKFHKKIPIVPPPPLKFKKESKINSETMRNMRQLHPRWTQLYGQPKIHKLRAPIRPVVSFYNTPLSALHKVLVHYLKPLANSSIRLKDTNDFKQHLNTTGHPNFPYHTSLDIKSLYTSCDMKKSISTTILHFQDKPHLLPPNISASTIQSLISFCLDNSYFEFNGQFYSQDTGGTMGSPLVVELAEIRVADVKNTALATYKLTKTLPTPTDTLSTTELETFVINLSTENLHTPTYISI